MRFLRAFAWLRWRLLANSLRAAERRDMVERVSRVTALVAPGFLIATSITSVVVSTGFGVIGGWVSVMHRTQSAGVLPAIRVFLLLATVFAVFVPLFVGMHGGAARFTRLLLLPIPRRTLHFVEVVTGLADPWLVFVLPGLVGFGAGMIVAALAQPGTAMPGARVEGVVALVAGAGMALVLASLSALVAFLVGWIVRDRRRSELFVIVLVLALSVVSIVPAIVSKRAVNGSLQAPHGLPPWTIVLPSELYGEALKPGLPWLPLEPGRHGRAVNLVGLFLEGGILYAVSFAVHKRLIELSGGGRTHRRTALGLAASARIPGLWPGTSAVAVAQARTALRSVRGRLVVLLPGPVVGMLALLLRNLRQPGAVESMFGARGWPNLEGPAPHLLLALGIILGLYAAQPFTMNQFGSDRAGLTLQFLAPIRDVDLIRGKAIGCGTIIGAGVLITLTCMLMAAPHGSPLLWLATLAGGVATYLVLTPVAALFSVLLPVAADLSKTGTGGNPHSLAMLAGMIFVGLAATPVGIALVVLSPLAAVLVLTIWMTIAWMASYPLLGLVARVLRGRRENLALIAQGR
jgi:hypothetical protein